MKLFGPGIAGGIVTLAAIAVLSKNPAVLSNFTGGAAQLLSVAMGGQYTGVGGNG